MSTNISLELKTMASGMAGNTDDGDRHSEVLILREAARLLDQAANFISGFEASAESGFTRQRAARKWLLDLHESKALTQTVSAPHD